MTLAEKLQNLRKKNGLSQEELADRLGISRQAVSKWESGQSVPDLNKLILLSEVYGVTIDSLVKEEVENIEENDKKIDMNEKNQIIYKYKKIHYEYKSKITLLGIPLVHINIGSGLYVAKGLLAIGNISIGLLSIGLFSLGLLAFGVLSLGLLSIGALSLGLLFSTGGIAVGTIAIGGIAIGGFTIGGLSIGVYSIGGCAIASNIAVGDYANGHIAIGHTVKGTKTIIDNSGNFSSITAEQVKDIINQEYPDLWEPIMKMITLLFR